MAVKVELSLPPRARSNQPGRPVPPPLLPGALSGFCPRPTPPPGCTVFMKHLSSSTSFHLNDLHIQGTNSQLLLALALSALGFAENALESAQTLGLVG